VVEVHQVILLVLPLKLPLKMALKIAVKLPLLHQRSLEL
jgi:hypothetical protein